LAAAEEEGEGEDEDEGGFGGGGRSRRGLRPNTVTVRKEARKVVERGSRGWRRRRERKPVENMPVGGGGGEGAREGGTRLDAKRGDTRLHNVPHVVWWNKVMCECGCGSMHAQC